MYFQDRVSAYPNRYLMTTADGSASYVLLERADEPTQVGTPLNAETFNSLLLCQEGTPSGCFYYTDGADEYWLNPPMFPGVAYRTLERYNGKPVYVKRIVFDKITENKKAVMIEHGESNITPIRCTGYLKNSSTGNVATAPLIAEINDLVCYYNFDANQNVIAFRSNGIDNTDVIPEATMWFIYN